MIKILTDKDKINLIGKIGTTDTFTITNFKDLENVIVKSSTDDIFTKNHKNGKITVKSVSNGTGDIRITADNSNELKVVNVNVVIEVSPEEIDKKFKD